MRKIWIWSLTVVFCLVLFLSADAAVRYVFERQWGGSGSGDGQFSSPQGLAINSSGSIFVADRSNHRIQKFDNNGTFLSKKGEYPQISSPTYIAFASGYLYILDYRYESFPAPGGITGAIGYPRIQKFGPDPTGSGTFGSLIAQGEIRVEVEAGERETLQPEGLAVDSSGNIYISDSGNKCIKKYRLGLTGITFIKKWGNFGYPKGIVVDSGGNVYVADIYNCRIQRFTSEGVLTGEWGRPGDGNGEFNSPTELLVDSSKNVYVIDFGNHRVQVFRYDPAEPYKFKFSAKFGSEGAGEGQFSDPKSIAVDASHRVYVLDGVRIQKFKPEYIIERELRPLVPPSGVPIPPRGTPR